MSSLKDNSSLEDTTLGGGHYVTSGEHVLSSLKNKSSEPSREHRVTDRLGASPPARRRCSLLPRPPRSAPGGRGARDIGWLPRAGSPPRARRGDRYGTAALPHPRRGATSSLQQYELIFICDTVPSRKGRQRKGRRGNSEQQHDHNISKVCSTSWRGRVLNPEQPLAGDSKGSGLALVLY
jgi:hypothetical protein